MFDPQRMCWLKVAPQFLRSGGSASGAMSMTTEDDEDDPFAGLDDLEDERKSKTTGAGSTHGGFSSSLGGKDPSSSEDEFHLGEEFDVGPEFIRRQRNEEEKWRRRLDAYRTVGASERRMYEQRWAIRSLVR